MKNTPELALGYDDISLLPNFSDFDSRKEVNTKTLLSRNIEIDYPMVLSPMDTVSTAKACIKMNQIGAAGILHRFMSIEEQSNKSKEVKNESNKSFCAIGLKDYKERLEALNKAGCDLFFLDTANGLAQSVFDFTKWYYKESGYKQDLIVGNTLSKESVSRLANVGADGFRHLIGPGSACLTQVQTGIGSPSVTGLYYAWKAIRNWKLYNNDWNNKQDKVPSVLADGGVRIPADLCKAVASGADGAICGGAFNGCFENTNEEDIIEKDGKLFVKYKGMASKETVEQYGLSDKSKKNLFVEGDSYLKPYKNKSVEDVVYEFSNGLRSCMTYVNARNISEIKGGLWNGKINFVRITANSMYERGAHGKG